MHTTLFMIINIDLWIYKHGVKDTYNTMIIELWMHVPLFMIMNMELWIYVTLFTIINIEL